MAQRLELQAVLVNLLGSNNVYYQPPPSVKMQYPCIVYTRDNVDIAFADNKPYKNKTRYQIMIIDPNPDSEIHHKVGELPMVSYDRFYTADNLNHDVYHLFF